MSERLELAEYFILQHGKNAARVLETLPADVAGELIDAIADDLSTAALKSMLPYNAARCVVALAPESGARYLAGVPVGEAAAILWHMSETDRENLVDLLPRQQAIRVSLLLRYPRSLVGAWIDPFVLTLPLSGTVGDAKERVANEGYEYESVFVVDDDNRVRGSVPLARLLLQAADDDAVSSIMRDEPDVIRASSSVVRAADAAGWARRDLLPVTDRGDRFIGVLRYAQLRGALQKPAIAEHAAERGDNLMGITEACYVGLADVLATALAENRDAAAQD